MGTGTPQPRHIDAIGRDLLTPLLRHRRTRSGWRLVGWDAEQGFSLTYERGDVCLLIELEDRDDARPCYLRTERFNVHARPQFVTRRELTAPEHRLVAAVVEAVRRREGRLPVFERPTSARKSAVREVTVDRVLIPEGHGQYYINPYVGCMIGCTFCYVGERADLSRRLEGLPHVEWGRYVDVKTNAADVLRREVRSLPPGIVRLSPILTDPYQGLERRYRITRQCLEVLAPAGFDVVVLTRAARIVEDIDLLRRFRRAVVAFSIPTDIDAHRRVFEPGADPVEERFAALEACHAAGLRTALFVQPMLPMNVDRLVERVAPFVQAVRIDRMYGTEQLEPLYRRAGILEAAGEAFFERTGEQLVRAFRARGVQIDDMDDLEPVLGG